MTSEIEVFGRKSRISRTPPSAGRSKSLESPPKGTMSDTREGKRPMEDSPDVESKRQREEVPHRQAQSASKVTNFGKTVSTVRDLVGRPQID